MVGFLVNITIFEMHNCYYSCFQKQTFKSKPRANRYPIRLDHYPSWVITLVPPGVLLFILMHKSQITAALDPGIEAAIKQFLAKGDIAKVREHLVLMHTFFLTVEGIDTADIAEFSSDLHAVVELLYKVEFFTLLAQRTPEYDLTPGGVKERRAA